jgi:hypothetical protein
MKVIVRQGYIVFVRNRKYEAGAQIPASDVQEVLANQSWKVEVFNGKKEKGSEETETAAATGSGKEKEVIKDIAVDRMIKAEHTKKRV